MVASTSQLTTLGAVSSNGVSVTSQAVMMVAHAPPSTRYVRTSQLVGLVSDLGPPVPACSQLVGLIAFRTGSVENLKMRAWSFALDGHTFYSITLGEQGTFVYDESTEQWAKWQTQGLPGWNMEIGTTWHGKTIAADQSQPIIYALNPTSFIDDGFKTQIRRVTGGVSMRGRDFPANYAFRITASLGEPDVADTLPATSPVINLSYSDDQGKSFVDAGDVVITSLDFVQEIAWLSLGTMQPPQRVFRVTDTGAIVRLDDADAEFDEG